MRYIAPASRILTVLHILKPDDEQATRCGLELDAGELWREVGHREGDRVCEGCLAPDRAQAAGEALW